MLKSFFSKAAHAVHNRVYYNPTQLPDCAIERLCSIADTEAERDVLTARLSYNHDLLVSYGYKLPAFEKILESAQRGQLRDLLLNNINPNAKKSNLFSTVPNPWASVARILGWGYSK
ncbi:MAG: hypothetical protein GY797_35555 [Deltaproteobacteria bacterium]|nr:hypothetical protein [Deltaproteobacteria bacterium]